MSEIHQLGEHTFYIEQTTNVGVYIYENKCCLIDAGIDKSFGKAILNIIDERKWKLEKIFLTHSHADHAGACAYLKEQTGCAVYAPGVCAQLVRYPYLIPTTLYGGFPSARMRSKFVMPEACECEELSESVMPKGLSFMHIDGHDFEQAAFCTSDKVWFIGDAVSDKTTIDRYRIPFLYDIKAHLSSLERLKNTEGKIFVPSHSKPVNEIKTLCDENTADVFEVCAVIKRLCENAISIDELIAKLLGEFGIKLYVMQYELIGETARSYLSFLTERKEIECVFNENRLLWKKVLDKKL